MGKRSMPDCFPMEIPKSPEEKLLDHEGGSLGDGLSAKTPMRGEYEGPYRETTGVVRDEND